MELLGDTTIEMAFKAVIIFQIILKAIFWLKKFVDYRPCYKDIRDNIYEWSKGPMMDEDEENKFMKEYNQPFMDPVILK